MQENSNNYSRSEVAPKISVVIPTYNDSDTIERALSSVRAQTMPVSEIIIVDDGSSRKIELPGSKIKLVRHSENLGAAAARNTGIRSSTGEFIAFLDSDDEWHSEKLASQVRYMQEKDCNACCTGFSVTRAGRKGLERRYWCKESYEHKDVLWGCYMSPGSTLVVRKKIFEQTGFYDETLERYEDWDWIIRYCRTGSIGYLEKDLATVHIGKRPGKNVVNRALDIIDSNHSTELDTKEYRKLRAGIMIEKASLAFHKKNILSCLYFITRSFIYCPINNLAIRKVVLSKLWGS